jgi:hypothetical protein
MAIQPKKKVVKCLTKSKESISRVSINVNVEEGIKSMENIVFDTQDLLSDNNLGDILEPWQVSPYQLISWWDMEQFSAIKFYSIAVLLERIKQKYSKKILNIAPVPVDEDIRLELEKLLRPIEQECQKLGLRNSVGTINEFRTFLLNWRMEAFSNITPNQIAMRIDEIDRAIRREIGFHLFMYIPPDKAEYYHPWGEERRVKRGEEVPLFGNAVATKFPSTNYDIREAGNSFAFYSCSACVYHLMGVLEIGLMVLAKRFNVSTDRTNWHNIIEQIEAKIKGMGNDPNRASNWKEEQEFYSQVATHFMFLKEGWRNYTEHHRGKYNSKEAEIILVNVRSFMQKLAVKLSE